MDIKVYKKETVKQPSGAEEVFVPDVIDIIPELVTAQDVYVEDGKLNIDYFKKLGEVRFEDNKLFIKSDNIYFENGKIHVKTLQLNNCETINGKEELEQACTLATIFQKGLDPLDVNDGIRWSQAIREELSVLQLMQDITEAVTKVSSSVKIVFDTVEDEKGNQYLSYKVLEVA